jgi:hypothetical protein
MRSSPPTRYTPYSAVGLNATATLAGSVQGVVVQIAQVEAAEDRAALGVGRGEAHVDRRRGVIFVFDLGFGQGGLVVDAPQRRAQALIEVVVGRQIGQRLDDRGFVGRRDRHVRIVEAAERRADAQHLRALFVQPIERALAARTAQCDRIGAAEIEFEVREGLAFDRQTVHVPARHEIGDLAVEQMDLHQRVFEEAVEEGPHVHAVVGVGRTVGEDERRAALRAIALETTAIRIVLRPPRDAFRLALGELGAHREVGRGQVEGGAKIASDGLGHGRLHLRVRRGRYHLGGGREPLQTGARGAPERPFVRPARA